MKTTTSVLYFKPPKSILNGNFKGIYDHCSHECFCFTLDLDEDNPVLYLKCRPCHTLDIDLILPLTNEAKEKALAFAARQQMSDVEYQRRLITGTLESSSIRVAIAILGLTRVEVGMNR